ncbi:MAG: DUF1648 domain-containing protein [Gordonia sp. (in: high G+C Gram-positive bacteria)]|uniref:DUF1648 domain-containing protein n=1 Tax=Gordonia sp. (in: high G+C Gram-positive bacteria) TaxID=84139 RepID=UPI0039E5402D
MTSDRPENPTPMSDDEVARRRPVTAFVAVAVVLPVVIVAVAVAVQISLLGSLPDAVAVHWTAAGDPDRFLPAWSSPLLTAVLGLAAIALSAGPAVAPVLRGDAGAVYRLLGGTSLGTAILIAIAFTGGAWYQAGPDADAASVPIVSVVAVALLSAVVIGGIAGALLPRPPRSPRPEIVAPLPLDDDEQAVWIRTTTASPGVLALSVAGFAMALATVFYAWAAGEGTGTVLGAAVIAAVIVLAAATTTAFRITVSRDGLEARSLAGFPRLRVPLDEIVEVRVDPAIRPMNDFGGVGLRQSRRRTGVVPRAGEGILIDRTGDRVFGVVVDDAVIGGALLAALVDRARADRAKEVEQ